MPHELSQQLIDADNRRKAQAVILADLISTNVFTLGDLREEIVAYKASVDAHKAATEAFLEATTT